MAGTTWFVTGVSRGLGFLIAQQALAAGHRVAATARRPEGLAEALGGSERVLALPLDVTDPQAAETAVRAVAERWAGSTCS
jgi:NAD(P)-dependent dehydrogenase (short-subunit alcohol dehydrogenase family)